MTIYEILDLLLEMTSVLVTIAMLVITILSFFRKKKKK